MTVENRYKIQLNMKSTMFREVPEIVANDKVVFEVKVYDGPDIFPLLETYTYHLTSLKLGGQSVIREGVLSGNVILFELGTSEMTDPGKVEGTVQIFDETNKRISSTKFFYMVRRDPSLQGSLPADDTTLVIANESLLTETIQKADAASTDSAEAISVAAAAETKATAAEATANEVRSEFDLVVAEAGSSNPEVVLARGSEATLKARLDSTDAKLAETAKRIENNAIDITDMPKDFAYASAKGDGSDETVTIQRILDYIADNHKTALIPQGKTFIVADMYLTGKNNFTILGYGLLKRKNAAANQSILTLRGCSDVYIPILNTDGNVNGNGGTVQEGQHSLRIIENNGVPSENITIGILNDKNPSGDTLYINNANKLVIDYVKSVSDSWTGRNGISIIKGEDILIGQLLSLKTGYYNSANPSASMPGGFDIEPNLTTDNVRKVTLSNAVIVTAGTGGCQVTNFNGATCDYIDLHATVKRYYNNTNYLFTFNNGKNINAKCIGEALEQTNGDCKLMSVVSSSHINLDVDLKNGDVGILLDGTTEKPTEHFSIKGVVNYCNTACVRIRIARKGEIDCTLKNPQYSATPTKGVIISDSGATSSRIIFRGDYSKDERGEYCFIINGNVTNWRAESVNMYAWTDGHRVVGATAGNGGLFAVNCAYYNFADTPSTQDAYAKGMVVWKENPTAGGKIGSVCTASGLPATFKSFGAIDA